MNTNTHWARFKQFFLRYSDLGFFLDISRMNFPEDFLCGMAGAADLAVRNMRELERGAIANPDENRMVGHYWLRAPELAPNEEIRRAIEGTRDGIVEFAKGIHSGAIRSGSGERFTDLLLIGIGGSALGPQLVSDALGTRKDAMRVHFFDNTDPDGMERVLCGIGERLRTTLVAVVSKSGGTKEARNGMLVARAAYQRAGMAVGPHFVAVTGEGSELDRTAEEEGWLRRFPMFDWVGGRTSVMSAVGLLPMALQGLDVMGFLEGARCMDE
ncbi:MAG: glucose-6-phosphate isomerase, partial [Chthoniobacterales bacterium]|nr:glucose-6-phosphate isomerase [Chthoniobacterales bacterium]